MEGNEFRIKLFETIGNLNYSWNSQDEIIHHIVENSLTYEYMEEMAQQALKIIEKYPEEEAVKQILKIKKETVIPQLL